MTYFPLFYNFDNREVLIAGGDRHAYDKIIKLLPLNASITVIDENICDEIKNIRGIKIYERAIAPGDFDINPVLCIITQPFYEAQKTAGECKKRHIPVNAVDMPKLCDVIFPAVISTENLSVGISSGGLCPTAAVAFKKEIEKIIPEETDSIILWLNSVREKIPREKRKAVLKALFYEAILKKRPLTDSESAEFIK